MNGAEVRYSSRSSIGRGRFVLGARCLPFFALELESYAMDAQIQNLRRILEMGRYEPIKR